MIDLSLARAGLEMLYTDTCTVSEYRDVYDTESCITSKQLVIVAENIPCRVSTIYHKHSAAGGGMVPSVSKTMKLFLASEINIKAGSKIAVTRNGTTTDYTRSGEPVRYTNHQEIMIELEEEYA